MENQTENMTNAKQKAKTRQMKNKTEKEQMETKRKTNKWKTERENSQGQRPIGVWDHNLRSSFPSILGDPPAQKRWPDGESQMSFRPLAALELDSY